MQFLIESVKSFILIFFVVVPEVIPTLISLLVAVIIKKLIYEQCLVRKISVIENLACNNNFLNLINNNTFYLY